jgi:fumarate reductase subunit D
VLAASDVNGLLLLLFAVGGFAVVAVVAAVILALIQAVLPSGDTEADALHAEELKRAEAAEEEGADVGEITTTK